ncbi:hypothetical protein FA13DRAFT_1736203 [Coprinellus micaceus]|uniref:Hydrophobin n=1 Tax=Coprinellus micaceus TaxID=71717 RepID=A0A4Y7T2H5_COPMI|nr:hypothetical protein FA13DRAFT_1742817 [Coprinellus micaceus]TEB27739.1 hypothetical protein FA13DRAFT_1736203 [Coprinellus micaceus]
MNLSAFFTLALASVLTFSSTAVGQDCPKPACCDVLVKGADDTNVGLNCTEGGIDCTFGGQVKACCESINSFTKVGMKCESA